MKILLKLVPLIPPPLFVYFWWIEGNDIPNKRGSDAAVFSFLFLAAVTMGVLLHIVIKEEIKNIKL